MNKEQIVKALEEYLANNRPENLGGFDFTEFMNKYFKDESSNFFIIKFKARFPHLETVIECIYVMDDKLYTIDYCNYTDNGTLSLSGPSYYTEEIPNELVSLFNVESMYICDYTREVKVALQAYIKLFSE